MSTPEFAPDDYLETRAMHRMNCFEKKNPDACFTLGQYLTLVEKRPDQAAKVYQHTCDAYSHGPSCFYLSSYLLLGRGGLKKDTNLFLKYADMACSKGVSPACAALGYFHDPDSKGIPNMDTRDRELKDFRKSMKYFDKACDRNNYKTCMILAEKTFSGNEEQKYEKDFKKALAYATKACEGEIIEGCHMAHKLYQSGEGVPVNEKLANLYLSKAKALEKIS